MIGGLIFDILSHGFWGGIIFRKRSHYWLAFIFGILPDALAFGPLVILRIMAGDLITGKPGTNTIPPWVYTIYAWTHSLVIAGLIIIILLYINKKIGVAAGAWILHIFMDIPVHTREYFPTPFLFPLSDFTFSGVSSIKLWAVNWTVLIIVYLYSFLKSKRAWDFGFNKSLWRNK
jgi:hypothetical protein